MADNFEEVKRKLAEDTGQAYTPPKPSPPSKQEELKEQGFLAKLLSRRDPTATLRKRDEQAY